MRQSGGLQQIATSDEEIVSVNDQAFRVSGIFLIPDRAASVVDMNVGEGHAGCGNSMCRKNNFQRDEDRPSH
jgi:hypothetical protein